MPTATANHQAENFESVKANFICSESINPANHAPPESLTGGRSTGKEIDFKEMFESLSVMFYVENFVPVYQLEYISPAFECLGYTLDEIYADPKILDRVIHPDDLLMMKEENKQIYDGTIKESSYSYRVFTKSGEMRWWKDQGSPIFNEKGERVKWFGVIHDITDRKNAIEELKESNKKLEKSTSDLEVSKNFVENILVSMADMLITVDDDGIIQRVNESALQLLGYEETELLGRPARVLTQKDAFLTAEEFDLMLETGKLVEIEKDFVRRNGEQVRVSISSSLLRGKHAAAVIVAKDISKRIEDEQKLRQYAAKLEQSNRELQDFAYVASHDLQEPLRKVQAFGDRLQRKCAESLSEEGRDYVQRMRNASARMQTLIDDLLTFSRVTSNAKPFEPVDLKKIAEEVSSDLEVRIEQTGGGVEIGELPTIDADPSQMRQLFQNLIGNALKFHRPDEKPVIKIYSKNYSLTGGSFVIEGKQIHTDGDNSCEIVIEDNGIGFEEKYLDRIFTVFQRLHGRAEYEGSGIGLAVCRKIVERQGGTITASSQPGKGSAFFITLPVKQFGDE